MRPILGAATAMLLMACATVEAEVPLEDPVPLRADTLPAQTLQPGECGLFGWDTTGTRPFVFFATEQRALYVDGATVLTPEAEEPFPASRYDLFTLELGPAETVADATRYPSAKVRQTLDDGFEKVRPLVVLLTCQDMTVG